MNDDRYIRQTTLPSFGKEGQAKLAYSKVLIVGAGGLGIPVLQYLNAMGVGTLGIVENDRIDISNLQRQTWYAETDIGKPKIEVIVKKLEAQNSQTSIIPFAEFFNKNNAERIAKDFDIIVDCSDNFETRYLINDVCILQQKSFVYGALHAFEGQVSVFNFKGGPTYRCLFPNQPTFSEIPDCNVNGVLGIIPGIIGNFQALETIKIITGLGKPLSGKLMIYDGLNQSIQKIGFKLDPKNLKIKALSHSYHISEENLDLEKLLSSEMIIDVRSPNEFEKEHLPNSINIPLENLENSASEINKNTQILLVCQSGVRSLKGTEILKNIGFKALKNFPGGMNNYKTHVASQR
ncbi:HesA/MoeB/ThiF family protein [Gramella sp. AN32]|uniref:ThiF family adenylyltransferase n=1 Tax=Christiangramia antarctica TaxID=2058158 RepID=A0ABW5X868_9FLAO|nr:HesA/MoeB/ThiF family protein [Gramella sp. AN32]MCM4156209.1 sulfurtransferase [Gramella sp. AN32]